MVMKPLAFKTEDRINVRAVVPLNVWSVLVRVGRLHAELVSTRKITDERAGAAGLVLLLRQIGEHFENGDASWLTSDFQKALKSITDDNFGSAALDGAQIDISKLHRNKKLKSGYEGVYANGQGYRATTYDFMGKHISIGTFQTAEEAAYRRLAYHRVNNLAYGELETEMREWRLDPPKWGVSAHISDEQLVAQIKNHCNIMGTYDMIFGPGCVTIEPAYSSKLPKREEALARPALSRPAPPKQLPAAKHEPEPAISVDEPEPEPAISVDGITPHGFEPGDLPPGWE